MEYKLSDIEPAEGFYLCRPLTPDELKVSKRRIHVPLGSRQGKEIPDISVSCVMKAWNSAGTENAPVYKKGNLLVHRQGAEFQPDLAVDEKCLFLHHSLVLGLMPLRRKPDV